MATNLFKALKPEKHLSKSGFDLSQKHVFSSKVGQLIPCMCLEVVPDDYHEIDLAALMRTNTLNTAAFLRGKQRFDFFFVPYSQLWHGFNQFITRRSDKHSTRQLSTAYCPNISLKLLLTEIYNASSSVVDINGYRWKDNAIRLLDMLGYGNYQAAMGLPLAKFQAYLATIGNKYVNVFRLAAYQHIWYDFYRNKYYDTGDSGDASSVDVGDYVSFFNFDDIDCSTVARSHIPMSTADELSRVHGLLGMRYVQWKKDLFTSALPGQQFGVVSAVDLNLNDINTHLSIYGNGDPIGTLTSHDTQLSSHLNTSSDSNLIDSGQGLKFVTNDGTPSSTGRLKATGSGVSSDYSLYHQHTIGSQNVNGLTDTYDSLLIGTDSNVNYGFDVLTLYKAQMLQNWKQATLRAGNMTDDNFMAHYGVTPRYEGDENVDYLGSFDASLQINAVEATATTGETINGKVGELGATGTAVTSGHKISYKSRDFGVIMCVASFLPESEYNANMIDKANTLMEEFDFFTPEFENIGLEAVPRLAYDFSSVPAGANVIMGYAPRYWMYKTALDKVHGEFSTQVSETGESIVYRVGSLAPWVAPRTEFMVNSDGADTYRSIRTFYVQPSVYNNPMGVAVDSSQETDQLLHNVFFDIKSIRPMSVLGLPQF